MLASLEEKHRAEKRELVEVGFKRSFDYYKQILDRNLGIQLRLAEVSPLQELSKEGNLVDTAYDKIIVRLS